MFLDASLIAEHGLMAELVLLSMEWCYSEAFAFRNTFKFFVHLD